MKVVKIFLFDGFMVVPTEAMDGIVKSAVLLI